MKILSLFGEETPLKYSFMELQSLKKEDMALEGQWIEIRGFLYESSEYGLVLASEPNLKSCCVGSASKRGKQLIIEGDAGAMPRKGMAVSLQGILHITEEKYVLRLTN